MYNTHIKNKLYTFFIREVGMRDYTRGWLKGDCPFCSKENKFGVKIEGNVYHCFVCNRKGSLADLILFIKKFRLYTEVWGYLKGLPEIPYKLYPISKVTYDNPIIPPVKLPSSYQIINSSTSLGKVYWNYAKNRKLDPEALAKKGWGFCTEGSYEGYLLMPFIDAHRLVYYLGRNVIGSGPKIKNPPQAEVGIGKSFILYNREALERYNEVNIVESVINAETIGDNSVASLGKIISPYQLSLLLRSSVRQFNIILDPDALSQAIDLGLKLVPYKKVKLIKLPDNKDVNDVGREYTLNQLNSSGILTSQDLLKMRYEKPRT